MRTRCFLLGLLLAASAFADTPALGDLGKVGTVHFPISCGDEAQAEFQRGVALLHSFFYGEARRVFTGIAEREPDCAMAHWGVAMTWFHALWAPPSPDEIKAGLAAVERAEAAGAKTERERDYVAAIATLYRAPVETDADAIVDSCHGAAASTIRRADYVEALRRLHERYPDDGEAAAFYALTLIHPNPLPTDIPRQLEAAGILEKLWTHNRDHPGVVHYLIHAYDYPSLARRGLPAADHYANIAPWVPHALHMPSHIYTRLGMWEKSIASNRTSAEASRAYGARHHPGTTYFEELHATDYLVYAHLQRGEEAEAKLLVDFVMGVKRTYPEDNFAVAYAVGAVPARYAIERHAWQEAVELPRAAPELVARFPFDAAHVEFVRAVGQVRTGDIDGAKRTLARIDELGQASTDPAAAYFRRQLDIQHLAAKALIAQAEGRGDEAVAQLRQAADDDDTLGKHPVSPGSLYPIRELLGELMLELGRADDALAAFERSLELNPGRLNALRGAARAAELAGQHRQARLHHQQILAQTNPEPTIAQSDSP